MIIQAGVVSYLYHLIWHLYVLGWNIFSKSIDGIECNISFREINIDHRILKRLSWKEPIHPVLLNVDSVKGFFSLSLFLSLNEDYQKSGDCY